MATPHASFDGECLNTSHLLRKWFKNFLLKNPFSEEKLVRQNAVFRHPTFKADLPSIEGTTIRSYPSFFENYYWNSDVFPEISVEEARLIGEFYLHLLETKENSINIAIKRLNQCLVRDNEEDSVLDSTIALEALFSDGGNQEMTHKLAMRAAALSKLDENFGDSPINVFNNVKNIYDYRSSIIHGNKNLDKKRIIKLSEEKSIPVNNVAKKYLTKFIKIMLLLPEYRSARRIDENLLLENSL